MKKENKKNIGRSVDFERETRVLLEDMRSSIKIIAEGHSGLNGRLDKVDGRLDKVDGRLDKVEQRLAGVESELDTVKMAVLEVGSHVNRVDARMERLEKKIERFEGKVDKVIDDHETRFKKIENRLSVA